ncbi:hypothetical protein TBLA_0A09800 [Henningerozyma blattae CBS 6284]|uniref:ATP synthase subunit H, mitochondrial n=1 Tax=Henningerozyma blattae (strain ATCC 34711 / CBS 6284 / DSM 70876 / NBRC 10599 / NRRL Y-10934 / UCD 77-7) TaxID=1071380 RepID=I2GXB1_HENB6|nr:hypothetical protein TBLA_0A09800 [Tetrapisispora blattae CBS 6284]CCH58763.1 hypothetical protein TBLA_0A09800 [Tetrapisispora blattae CBS 6284]
MFRSVMKTQCRTVLNSATRTMVMKRTISSTPIARDLLSNLYVKEINSASSLLAKQDFSKLSEEGVKQWKAPAAPKSPEVEAQSKDSLNQYLTEDVEVISKAAQEEVAENEEDWLVLED